MKIIYLSIGGAALGLGMLGVVLPGLPTIPLFLLAAACFAKGSGKVHKWLTGTFIYKKYCSEIIERGGMSRSAKIRILVVSTLMMGIAIIFAPLMWIRLMILVVIIIKYYIFIVRIPTL